MHRQMAGRIVRNALGLGIVTLGVAAHAQKPAYPVPAHAFGLEHVDIKGSGDEEDDFSIKLPYPSTAVFEHYRKFFKPPWQECRWGNEGGWWTYVDMGNGRNSFVHQRQIAWVNQAERSIVLLGVRYVSAGEQPRCEPDNDIQRAVLLVPPPGKLNERMEALGVMCSTETTDRTEEGNALRCGARGSRER